MKTELSDLIEKLSEGPTMGTPLGNGVYKIRLAISSKGKGKSGGGSVITFVKVMDEMVYLVSIYDKSSTGKLTKDQVFELLRKAGLL